MLLCEGELQWRCGLGCPLLCQACSELPVLASLHLPVTSFWMAHAGSVIPYVKLYYCYVKSAGLGAFIAYQVGARIWCAANVTAKSAAHSVLRCPLLRLMCQIWLWRTGGMRAVALAALPHARQHRRELLLAHPHPDQPGDGPAAPLCRRCVCCVANDSHFTCVYVVSPLRGKMMVSCGRLSRLSSGAEPLKRTDHLCSRALETPIYITLYLWI